MELASNGATPIRYKMVFGLDLMVEMNQMNKGAKDEGEALEIVSRLAFIMYCQAKIENKAEWNDVNKEAYLDFLETLEPMAIAEASDAIIGIYLGQTVNTSNPKKEEGRPNEN